MKGKEKMTKGRRAGGLRILLIMLWLGSGTTILVKGESSSASPAVTEHITDQLLSDMSLEQVQTLMDEMLGKDSFSIGSALKNMINGETVFSKEAVQQFLRSLF